MSREMGKPLISVIVPIYNVAPYLRKCLDSIKNQTMRQIEIICINDGSTDESGRIADEYKNDNDKRWPIFRVVHTENRGLSAARNRGLDEAIADWIMFVDSDDWVDHDFCRVPYDAVIDHKADMVIFGAHITNEAGKIRNKNYSHSDFHIINHEEAVDLGVLSWNKIYKKQLFEGIRYPEGRVFEEVATVHRLIYQASRILATSNALYYYRFRKGSISHSVENEKYRLAMYKVRCDDLISFGYPENKAKAKVYGAALRSYGRANGNICTEADEILNSLKGIPYGLSEKERTMLLIWRFNKRLYRWTYRLYLRLQIWFETR